MTDLDLTAKSISASELRLLAPKLEHFAFNVDRFVNDVADDAHVQDWLDLLPTDIKSLSFRKPLLQASSIPHLPQNLATLSIVVGCVTLADARLLPRQLRSLCVSSQTRRGDTLGDAPKNFPFWRIREFI